MQPSLLRLHYSASTLSSGSGFVSVSCFTDTISGVGTFSVTPLTHLSKAFSDWTMTLARIEEWPSLGGVTTAVVVIPGTLSFLIRHWGTQKAWMTSCECILKRIWRLTGT